MTKSERRAAYPDVAKFTDEMLAIFDGARVVYAKLPGYEWGVSGSAGVVPNVMAKEKRK